MKRFLAAHDFGGYTESLVMFTNADGLIAKVANSDMDGASGTLTGLSAAEAKNLRDWLTEYLEEREEDES